MQHQSASWCSRPVLSSTAQAVQRDRRHRQARSWAMPAGQADTSVHGKCRTAGQGIVIGENCSRRWQTVCLQPSEKPAYLQQVRKALLAVNGAGRSWGGCTQQLQLLQTHLEAPVTNEGHQALALCCEAVPQSCADRPTNAAQQHERHRQNSN